MVIPLDENMGTLLVHQKCFHNFLDSFLGTYVPTKEEVYRFLYLETPITPLIDKLRKNIVQMLLKTK